MMEANLDRFAGKKITRLDDLSAGVHPPLDQPAPDTLQELRIGDRVQPREPGAAVPVSPEQRRIWLHAELNPDLPLYNESIVILRRGQLDRAVFQDAFAEIVRRHESLRTTFAIAGTDVAPVIHPELRIAIPFTDLSNLPEEVREAEAQRLAGIDAGARFALDRAPLFRGRVVRMSGDEHRIFLTVHRMVADRTCLLSVLLPELTGLYEARSGDRSLQPAEPPLQYGDYAVWRESYLASPLVTQQLEYWNQQLAGDLPLLNLPADHPRPSEPDNRIAAERIDLPDAILEDLRAVSHAQGVALHDILLAAFNVLLFRYTRQQDLIVGIPADARRRPELGNATGCFLELLPVRTRPAAATPFLEFLMQVYQATLGARSAADVPFSQIVQATQVRRNGSHHPLFQAFFSIESPAPVLPDGWDLLPSDSAPVSTQLDLHLQVEQHRDRIAARFLYDAQIYEPARIRRMAEHWLVILRSLPARANSAIGMLPLLTGQELAQLTGPGGWNDTIRAFPQLTLHELIEAQARETPHAEALVFENVSWTYQELMDRADRLSAGLRKAGIGRGSLVAVLLHRSHDLLAGLLAILKSGAAYLPLDPQAPEARLALCIEDAQPAAILTQRSVEHLPDTTAPALFVEELGMVAESIPASPSGATPDDPAYVIHTSGTTGRPKGVEISHASFVNLLTSMQTKPGFSARDRLLAVTTISFDIAGLELFLPLISGGTVILASRAVSQDPWLLAPAIESSRCTMMQATPSTWLALLSIGWQGTSRPLKVLCGGEPLPRELATQLLTRGVELWNMYGPTETTVWSTVSRVTDPNAITIGKPIANTTAYVLDSEKQFLPVGVPGHLFLGGAGVARGYRGLPEKTAERFTHVESAGGARLYDTGDLAVRLADGSLQCMGRADNQVKVRGFRVELEAVEAAVRRHPQVAAAAARVWPDALGSNRLSVYVVGRDGAPPEPAALRSFLKIDQLDYMIPSDVIAMDALPLSLNGKVDRAKLPTPVTPPPARASAQPLTEPEQKLAQIWMDLLRVPSIARSDNFFDLGGHSVLVIHLQQRIHSAFGHSLSMAALFNAPTLEQQAALLENAERSSGLLAFQPKGRRSPLFWLHPPPLIGNLSEALGADQPVMAVGLTETDVSELGHSATMERIAARLVRTILEVQPQGPYFLGGLCTGGIVAFEAAAQLRAAGHDVPLLILLDAQNPVFYHRIESFPVEMSKLSFYLQKLFQDPHPESRVTIRQLFLRFLGRVAQVLPSAAPPTEMIIGQHVTETAAIHYKPPTYAGDVLLLQPKDRPKRVDHRPGWKAAISGRIFAAEVEGHHDHLLSRDNAPGLAAIISSALSGVQNQGADRSSLAAEEEQMTFSSRLAASSQDDSPAEPLRANA